MVKKLILALIRARNPVTMGQIVKELEVQCVDWEELVDIDKELAIEEAIQELVMERSIVVCVNLPDCVISFDLGR